MNSILILLLLAQPQKETNPLKIVLNSSITLYQKIISPSQGDVCNFSPSCSHFGKQAIEKHGPLWGSLMAADRFMRCNPWAYQYFDTYYSGFKNQKIYDPVQNNFIFGKIRKKETSSLIPSPLKEESYHLIPSPVKGEGKGEGE